MESATPPIAVLADKRFEGATEDWTTPALTGSNLKPVLPIDVPDTSQPGYTVELLQVQWRWGDPIDLYVMKPRGVEKPPVILYLFGYSTDTSVFADREFQKAATRDGFAAVGFVSALTGHRFHDRGMTQWFVSELPECLAVSAHDVQMVLNYLAKRDDLDMTRVGMLAQGSGGSIGILASAVDPRIKVLDVLDPWGNWPTWLATSHFVPENERANYVKPEFLKKVAPLEPIDWLPKIQAKRFRFQDAVFEAKTPTAAKEKLRAAAPPSTTFLFYKTIAEFEAAFQKNSVNQEWLEHELAMLPGPPVQLPINLPFTRASNSGK